MQLGYLCRYSADEVARAARLGFDCLELHASSISGDLTDLSAAKAAAKDAKAVLDDYGVGVSCIACYGNPLAGKPADEIKKYRAAFAIAKVLGAPVVATLAGGLVDEGLDANLKAFAKLFTRVADAAEKADVAVAFENWPGFGGGLPIKSGNLARSPGLWARLFEVVDSTALGLEFDPSHLIRIGIDPLPALMDFADCVYHVHAKDTEMLHDSVAEFGYFDAASFRYRIPGYGEINWPEMIAALVEIGYDGGVAIEHEDPVFSGDRFEEGLVRGHDVLYGLIHPGTI